MLNCRTSKSVTAFPQAFEICQITLKYPTPFVYRPIYLKSQTKSRWTMLHFWRFAFFPHKNKTLWLRTFLLWQCFFCLFLWLSEENCLKNCFSFIFNLGRSNEPIGTCKSMTVATCKTFWFYWIIFGKCDQDWLKNLTH